MGRSNSSPNVKGTSRAIWCLQVCSTDLDMQGCPSTKNLHVWNLRKPHSTASSIPPISAYIDISWVNLARYIRIETTSLEACCALQKSEPPTALFFPHSLPGARVHLNLKNKPQNFMHLVFSFYFLAKGKFNNLINVHLATICCLVGVYTILY